MPQPTLPSFSDDRIMVKKYLSVQQKKDTIYWFHINLLVFSHHVLDKVSFRLFCCQLINTGTATAADISKALKVNQTKLSRWARLARSSESCT